MSVAVSLHLALATHPTKKTSSGRRQHRRERWRPDRARSVVPGVLSPAMSLLELTSCFVAEVFREVPLWRVSRSLGSRL